VNLLCLLSPFEKVQAHHCGHRGFYFFSVAMPFKHALLRASKRVGGLSSVKPEARYLSVQKAG